MYPTDIAFYYALKLGHFFRYFFQRVWPGALAIPGYASDNSYPTASMVSYLKQPCTIDNRKVTGRERYYAEPCACGGG
jgi:hypothetical protein